MLTASVVLYKNNDDQINKIINCFKNSGSNQILYIIDNSPLKCININKSAPQIEYIANNSNIGFGAAHNIAIKKAINAGSTFHLVVNPDIIFDFPIITKLIEYVNQNPEIGLIMPKILYPNNTNQFLPKLLPTPIQLLKRKLKISKKLYNYWNSYYEMRNASNNIIYEAPIISGCFSLFKTEVFNKVGFYDERFFLYFEDFDISRRVGKYYKTIYYPMVSVHHEYYRGAHKSIKLLFIFIWSAIKYFNKWGWFWDKERSLINKKAIQKINESLK